MGLTANRCAYHPDRPASESFGAKGLCEDCDRERLAVVTPMGIQFPHNRCSVERTQSGRWSALRNEAPAHWLAHELEVKSRPGTRGCLSGFALELADVLRGRSPLTGQTPVCVGDVWKDLDRATCGLVAAVDRSDGLQLRIRRLCPKRQVVLMDDFYSDLGGRGEFFR